MPDLYRLSVGPVRAAYYQQQFQRFEALGKTIPTWNSAAAFFTLAWLILRKLWRPAGIYAAVLAALAAAWWLGLHGRVPVAIEAALCLLAALLLCVVPGFMANALYYQHVRQQTLKTLTEASSMAQARAILAAQAPTKERMHTTAAVQALVALGIGAWLLSQWSSTAPAPSVPQVSGPPQLVIPSVESLRGTAPQALTPEQPLPTEVPATPPDAAPSVPLDSTPAAEPAPSIQPAPEALHTPAAADAAIAAAGTGAADRVVQPTIAAAHHADELSIVNLAQSMPAAVAASHAAAQRPPAKSAPAATPKAAAQPIPAKLPASAAKTKTTPAKKNPAEPVSNRKQTSTPTPVTQRAANSLVAGKYYLNAGVFAQASNVDSAVQRLQAAKLNSIRHTVHSNKGTMTRLRIGPFDTRQQAEQAALKAKKLRIETSVYQQPKK